MQWPLQVLTIHLAQEEPTNRFQSGVSSHSRLDLEAQFKHVLLDIIGLQETHSRYHGFMQLRSTLCFAAAAGTRAQGGMELWVKHWVLYCPGSSLVLNVDQRMLIICLVIVCGVLQAFVGHGFDGTYPSGGHFDMVGNCQDSFNLPSFTGHIFELAP